MQQIRSGDKSILCRERIALIEAEFTVLCPNLTSEFCIVEASKSHQASLAILKSIFLYTFKLSWPSHLQPLAQNISSSSSYHNQHSSSWKKHAYCLIWYHPWIWARGALPWTASLRGPHSGLAPTVPISTRWESTGSREFIHLEPTHLTPKPPTRYLEPTNFLPKQLQVYFQGLTGPPSWVSPPESGLGHSL